MTEEKKEVQVQTRNTVQVAFQGEKGEYLLSLPIGSQLEESVEVCGYFWQALSNALAKHKASKEEDNKDELSNEQQGEAGDS